MAAEISDYFRKVAPNTGWQLNASGIADASVTSFTLVSATGLPTDTSVILTVDRVDSSGTKTPSKMERIKGIVSGSNVISCVRGVGGTAQSHAGGAVVEIVIDSVLENDKVTGLLVGHEQTGKHKLSDLDGVRYAADAGGDDTYAVTLDPAPTAYYAGMEVNFKPTTANTGACTLNVNSLGAKDIKKSVSTDLSTGDILAGQIVKVVYNGTAFELQSNIPSVINAPRGFLLNGKLDVQDSAGITVAVKTLAGTDPSTSDPVYIRIGDTVRSITSALSRSLADGTNWFNVGSAELATKEVDYFTYLVWDSNSSAVGLTFARIPSANLVSDFSSTTTNEKYCAGQSDFTSTDEVEVIGRFAATLSAGAGYTWTVPTFTASNLIQKPIYETRKLVWVPTITCSGSMTFGTVTQAEYYYKLSQNKLELWLGATGTTGGTASNQFFHTIPFTVDDGSDQYCASGYVHDSSNTGAWGGMNSSTQTYVRRYDSGNWGLGAGRGLTAYFNMFI